jgi:histidyl-tRNA synthetase
VTAIRAVKGTRDILPDEVAPWQRIEAAARTLFERYGYREIRTPIFEETELFARGIGTRPTSWRRRCTPSRIATARR